MAVQDLLVGVTADGTGPTVSLAGQSTVEVQNSSVFDEAVVDIEGALAGGEFTVIANLGTGYSKTFTTSYQGANQLRAKVRGSRPKTLISVKVGEP